MNEGDETGSAGHVMWPLRGHRAESAGGSGWYCQLELILGIGGSVPAGLGHFSLNDLEAIEVYPWRWCMAPECSFKVTCSPRSRSRQR